MAGRTSVRYSQSPFIMMYYVLRIKRNLNKDNSRTRGPGTPAAFNLTAGSLHAKRTHTASRRLVHTFLGNIV